MLSDKKGVVPTRTLLILVLIFVGLIFFNVGNLGNRIGLQEGSIFSSETYSETFRDTSSQTYYETRYETEYVKTDLCNLFQPIIIAGNSVAVCNADGGTWRCEPEFVGCQNLVNPIVNCAGSVTQYAMYQCQSVGGTYVCNPNNAYCHYT